MTTVDIVVPCYRYGRFLRQCVESLLEQQGVQIRVLILDDASDDDTPEVAAALTRQDRRVEYRRNETNLGPNATFNVGLEWVSATYSLVISADDYLYPGALQRATSLLELHPDMTFAFGRAMMTFPEGDGSTFLTGIPKFDQAEISILSGAEFIKHASHSNIVPTPTAVVRTSSLRKVGGYHLLLPHTADMELWLRLASKGKVGIIGEVQAAYRRHGHNLSLSFQHFGDIEQRKMALDHFLAHSAPTALNPERLRRESYRALATVAVGAGHRAFSMGHYPASRDLLRIARTLNPMIAVDFEWIKLAVKHRLGPRWFRVGGQSASAEIPPTVRFRSPLDRYEDDEIA